MSRDARKTALQKLKDARKALADLGPHHTDVESDEYLRRNRAVYEAEKNVRFGSRRGRG